jgi:hypothetical protein
VELLSSPNGGVNIGAGIMIDNYAEAMRLVQRMKAQLPILVHPTQTLIHSSRQSGITLTANQDLQVDDVLYLGDEGGIGCAILLPGNEKTLTITSLTHLIIPSGHPLAAEIKAYQAKRTQKLAKMQVPGKPARFTIKPRKKRKKR